MDSRSSSTIVNFGPSTAQASVHLQRFSVPFTAPNAEGDSEVSCSPGKTVVQTDHLHIRKYSLGGRWSLVMWEPLLRGTPFPARSQVRVLEYVSFALSTGGWIGKWWEWRSRWRSCRVCWETAQKLIYYSLK